MTKYKQGDWWIWDSHGGIHALKDHIQAVNFDLEANLAEWQKLKRRSGSISITGSIESGRLTYREGGGRVVEFWRDDLPNPTPYTAIANPDPVDDTDKARVKADTL